jgi:hypothetical protein
MSAWAGNVLRRPVVPTLIAVGVVVASVAGTVAVAGTGGGRGGGARSAAPAGPPPVRNAAWVVDGAHDASSLSALTGFWVGADVVVRGGVDGLHAMKRADGSAAWDLPTPGGGDLCGMSAGVDGGVGIVASHGDSGTRGAAGSADCSVVSGVDLATGKVLWTTPVSSSFGDPDAGAADYAVVGGVAVIDSDRDKAETGILALDLKTGVEKWKHSGECEHRHGAFAVAGAVAEARVAIAEVCQGQETVRVLDAVSGGVVADAPAPVMADAAHPQVLSVDPLAVADGGGNPRAQVSVGKDVLCVGGHEASCWSAHGLAVVPRELPNASAEHHDVYPVLGTRDAARVVTTGVPGHTRASLCRVAADGGVVLEADLSQPVSDYLGRSGTAGSYYVYGDANDLFVVDPRPNGQTAVIDVRLG